MPAFEREQLLSAVTALTEQAAEGTGIEIADVELRGSGKARLLRIYIDKPAGVTHADCELISERLGTLLDLKDVMPGDSYTLEVSSPGVERPLKKLRDFERVVGQDIKVSLREAVDGQKRVDGKLLGIAGDTIEVESESGKDFRLALAQIQKANLKFQW
jgi:ribosome maturation factor RimP